MKAVLALTAIIVFGAAAGCASAKGAHLTPSSTHLVPRQSASKASRTPTSTEILYAHTWALTTIELASGPRSVTKIAASAFTFTFNPFNRGPGVIGVTDGECDGATANVSPSQITFTQSFVNGLVAGGGCVADPDIDQARIVLGIMAGTVTWSVTNWQLTIHQPGAGSLIFGATD